MGITWLNPPFNGGFLWLVPQQGRPVWRAFASKERVCTAELSQRCTTLFIDLSALELSLVLTQPSGIRQQLREKRVRSLQTHAISSVRPSQDVGQMLALNGVLLLTIALSVLSSAPRALELGPCEPAQAVEIIDTILGEGKTLRQAMEMMMKAKVFDGSKACITFIRETSMTMRDRYPRAFKSLWLN